MSEKKYIYVVLVKALTGLGKFSRKISKYEYTHISVALDEKMDVFYTFSRKLHSCPFNAGFMREKREHYAFGNNEKVKIKVFKLPVSNTSYSKVEEYINEIEKDKEYIFNLYSMLTMPILHGFKIYKTHNCMSFVSKIIELTNIVNMDKKYYKYNIKEIDMLLNSYFYKEYYLEKDREDKEYMKSTSIYKNIKQFFILNVKLMYRLIFKI